MLNIWLSPSAMREINTVSTLPSVSLVLLRSSNSINVESYTMSTQVTPIRMSMIGRITSFGIVFSLIRKHSVNQWKVLTVRHSNHLYSTSMAHHLWNMINCNQTHVAVLAIPFLHYDASWRNWNIKKTWNILNKCSWFIPSMLNSIIAIMCQGVSHVNSCRNWPRYTGLLLSLLKIILQ